MKKAVIASIAAAVLGLAPLILAPAAGAADPPPHVEGQILVKFHDDRASAGVLKAYGLANGPGVGSTGARLISVPEGNEQRLATALGHNPAVEYAELDGIATALSDDFYFPRQYALENTGQSFTNTSGSVTVPAGTADADIDAPEAWTVTTGGGTKVAVLDTGVDDDHPDITPKVVGSANFSGTASNDDFYGHGTHVAGIIAATANNSIGVAGVCPSCTILDVKVLNDSGSGSFSAIAAGIDWAVGQKAKVINMSLGSRFSSTTLETAVKKAWAAGVVIVAAAGNTGAQGKVYPGAYTNVIAVAATDNNDEKASFSTYSAKWVDVAAPGASIYSTLPNHPFAMESNGRSKDYDIASGTSMASPVVAGTVALAWSVRPSANNSTVRSVVEATADPISGTGSYWIHGRVNAYAAVK
ncbi:S8 family serine peptidase [Sinomonas halotolerans]|uniref:S8 family serine peptidase n=1 Tax=Sinomonas halotolerans TaxID=1644133 RepID=A0ABU9X1T6_9MICC